MKQLLVATAVLFTALTMSAQSNVHSRFIQQGNFAQVATGVGNGNVSLQVQSGTDPNSPDGQGIATVLFYTSFSSAQMVTAQPSLRCLRIFLTAHSPGKTHNG